MLNFTQLSDRLKYPPNIRAKLSTLHSEIIMYVSNNFVNTQKYKNKVISVMNTISYYIKNGDTIPTDWSITNPLELDTFPIDKQELNGFYIEGREIEWDIKPIDYADVVSSESIIEAGTSAKSKFYHKQDNSKPIKSVKSKVNQPAEFIPTPKSNLYIKPPLVPRFDTSKPWLQKIINNTPYVIYKSLPEIPVMQSQISITTDVDSMTASDFLKLYPNCTINTRAATMYIEHDNLTLDKDVGILIPIVGFSAKQVKDNIIKYPHWFKLTRYINGEFENFYSKIEINGELKDTLKIWESLPESKLMPRNSEFIKEYVVRRYLLERDIKGIQHKYPILGTLEPFLTLFMTPDNYAKLGYTDAVEYSRKCVVSRVNYKRSRSPIINIVNSNP